METKTGVAPDLRTTGINSEKYGSSSITWSIQNIDDTEIVVTITYAIAYTSMYSLTSSPGLNSPTDVWYKACIAPRVTVISVLLSNWRLSSREYITASADTSRGRPWNFKARKCDHFNNSTKYEHKDLPKVTLQNFLWTDALWDRCSSRCPPWRW